MARKQTTQRGGGKSKAPQFSFVIPVYNEEESLPELYERIVEKMKAMRSTYEFVFVDDGSTDGSYDVLTSLHKRDSKNVRVIRFRRNFGKSPALRAAFELARGEYVFTMDADLQDDPMEIPAFFLKINEGVGYDLVSGWKRKRNDPWHKTFPSRIFNGTISRLFSLDLHDFNCGFKLYRRDVVKDLDIYGEMHRFLPVLAHARGFRVTEIPVHHNPRRFGVSKFGWRRFYRGFFDALTVLLLTKYLKRPLHFFGGVGILMGLAGGAIMAYLLVEKIIGHDIGGRPLFMTGILLCLGALQTLTIGLIGELLINRSSKPDDSYSIESIL